jgi:hypothetical protein
MRATFCAATLRARRLGWLGAISIGQGEAEKYRQNSIKIILA